MRRPLRSWDVWFSQVFRVNSTERLQVLTCMMELRPRHENCRPANKLSTINSINPHPSTVCEPVWVGRPLDPEITSIHVNSVDSNHNSKMFQVHPQKQGTQGTQMLTSGSSETNSWCYCYADCYFGREVHQWASRCPANSATNGRAGGVEISKVFRALSDIPTSEVDIYTQNVAAKTCPQPGTHLNFNFDAEIHHIS